MATIATLQRVTAKDVQEMVLAEADSSKPSFAIIDVRDDDHIGGHIKGSLHFPSRSLEAMMPTLVRRCEDKKTVIFHCALSQQRGPSAALRYIRESGRTRQRAEAAATSAATPSRGPDDNNTDGASGDDALAPQSDKKMESGEQKVLVLDQGFVGWQELYGEDERLTDKYSSELWKDGYWV